MGGLYWPAMSDWDEYRRHDDDLAGDERQTIRKVVVRFVAAALLFSLLGSMFLALRGIKDIGVVVGALAIVAVAAWIAKKQRESERPYRSDRDSDIEIR